MTWCKNTGKATTNHTSRAPNKKNRASDSRLMAGDLEKIWVNFGLFFATPSSVRKSHILRSHTAVRAPAMAKTAPLKPSHDSNTAPRKKPAPFRAFFEPVKKATMRYRPPCASLAMVFIELFALILLRSLAIPESACAAITQTTVR